MIRCVETTDGLQTITPRYANVERKPIHYTRSAPPLGSTVVTRILSYTAQGQLSICRISVCASTEGTNRHDRFID
jgi:hypothetical protein